VRRHVMIVAVSAALAGFGQAAVADAQQAPDLQASMRAQAEIESRTPQLRIREEILRLDVPGQTIGETEGVAKNSQGHLFVFTRTGSANGPARGASAARLFEFDQNYRFVKEWGPNNYALSFAHTVRVDKDDNVWITDEGSNMIVKFTPDARIAMVLGRKPEAVDYLERFLEEGDTIEPNDGKGSMGTYNRPTDVTWDSQGNIFIADGYNNARVVKLGKDGTWQKAVGSRGSGPDEFNIVHGITSDSHNNIYVADRTNRRIKVFDTDLNLKKTLTNAGQPWTVCVSPAPNEFLFSGDGNGKIYKLDMEGNLVGWAQTSLGQGQTGCLIHELHCESDTVVYKGACALWNVEKITITGTTPPAN
jgi:6-bladed beta-propeller